MTQIPTSHSLAYGLIRRLFADGSIGRVSNPITHRRIPQQLLVGRYVLTTSLDTKAASTADVVRHYKMLAGVERRFWVMKDFLGLRPVHHRTEGRVRAHIAVCVIAAVIEAVIGQDLARADVRDRDIDEQVMSPRRALRELSNIRLHRLDAGRRIELVDRPTPLQRTILDALSVDTSDWNRAAIA